MIATRVFRSMCPPRPQIPQWGWYACGLVEDRAGSFDAQAGYAEAPDDLPKDVWHVSNHSSFRDARRIAVRAAIALWRYLKHDFPYDDDAMRGIWAYYHGELPRLDWYIAHGQAGADPVEHAWQAARAAGEMVRLLEDVDPSVVNRSRTSSPNQVEVPVVQIDGAPCPVYVHRGDNVVRRAFPRLTTAMLDAARTKNRAA